MHEYLLPYLDEIPVSHVHNPEVSPGYSAHTVHSMGSCRSCLHERTQQGGKKERAVIILPSLFSTPGLQEGS